ncbi:TerB family tellurite resistance protein [Paremcibacter congregatus]|uniref:Molecular chaperone DjlA n=1 Tax=Paremcibacter congregatus TaxID=2043170 RepID=A0A2G4YTB9_9PROT|nr:TerB family tellurite resistance protein [Paremcibacter congregatus]PHZ85578.1 molecular chaperone DjlA [Paremcibacter congregatus]QDE26538.1 molecular chaperone DjiA [Paremcibacter congregatus]
MSIWSSIIGGAAGGAILGGPLGALLGAVAGHYIGKKLNEGTGGGTEQVTFTIGVIVLSAKMAKADGHVSREEIDAFKQAFKVPEGEMKNVARVFNMAKKDATGFEPYAGQLAKLFHDKPAMLEELLSILFYIAKADQVVHPAELDFLEKVSAIFGFSAAEFDRIRAENLGPDKADPYTILGVTRESSDKDIKSAYRKLIKEHHPDLLASQGLPKEFVEVANEKLSVINVAYDRIAKERGLK